MPQLIPFFFVIQVLFNFALLTIIIYILTIIIYIFTKYLLPRFVRLSQLIPPKPHAFVKLQLKSGVSFPFSENFDLKNTGSLSGNQITRILLIKELKVVKYVI